MEDPGRDSHAVATPDRPDNSLWQNSNYLLLVGGQTISAFGSTVSQVALPLLVLFLTHSPTDAGIAALCASLPYFLLSVPAPDLVAQWDRRQVMIACDVGRAAALGSIPVVAWFAQLTVWQLYAVALVEGALFTFFKAAEIVSLSHVVPRNQLPAAAHWSRMGNIIALLVGPGLGGALYQFAGRTIPFLADAVSYLLSALSVSLMRFSMLPERHPAVRWRDLSRGFAWLWRHPLVRLLALITGGFNAIGAASVLIVIVRALQEHASPTVVGMALAIGSLGGVMGSALAPIIQRRLSFRQITIAVTWAQALLFPLYAVAPHPVVLGLVAAALFLLGPAYHLVQNTYRLALIPETWEDEANAAFRLLAFGFEPLGALLTGVLLERIGSTPTILACTGVGVLLALTTSLSKYLRLAPLLVSAQLR